MLSYLVWEFLFTGGSLSFTLMHLVVMLQQNFQAHCRWLEEEYGFLYWPVNWIWDLSYFFFLFICLYQYLSLLFLQILADAMGLGKTIMTIALLVTHLVKNGIMESQPMHLSSAEDGEVGGISDQSPTLSKKGARFSIFHNQLKQKKLVKGGTLIICPMTLLGQWKVLSSFKHSIYLFTEPLHLVV